MRQKILIGHLVVLLALILNLFNPTFGVPKKVYAKEIKHEIPQEDPKRREKDLLYNFFTSLSCPISGLTDTFIEVSTKYSLDWRLLPAIAVKESTCGKRSFYFNPFGFGAGYFDEGKYRFSSFEEAIEYVGSAISGANPKERSFNKAGGEVERILWIYNGTVNPNYPKSVINIMDQIGTR